MFALGIMAMPLLGGCKFRGASGTTVDGGHDPDAAVVDGGHDPDAAVSDVRCGSPGAFVDDFDQDRRRWRSLSLPGDNTPSFAIENGRLTITIGNSLHGATSLFAIDLRDAAVNFAVPTTLSPGTSANIALVGSNNIRVGFGFGGSDGGSLSAIGPNNSTAVTDYNPLHDLLFRIHLAGSELIFEVARNSVWREVHRITGVDPADYRSLLFQVQAVAITPEGNAGTFSIDDLNTDAPTAPWCAINGNLADDFDDGMLNPIWSPLLQGSCTQNVTNIENNSGIQLDVTASDERARCILFSGPAFNVTDSSVVVQVPATITPPLDWTAFARLSASLDDYVELRLRQKKNTDVILCARIKIDGKTNKNINNCIDYLAGEKYWRISFQDDTVTLETSADQTTWRMVDSGVTTLDPSAMDFGVGIRAEPVNQDTAFSVLDVSGQ